MIDLLRILGGALVGGAVGFLLGGVRSCSSEQCGVRTPRLVATLAGAGFGGAMAAVWIWS